MRPPLVDEDRRAKLLAYFAVDNIKTSQEKRYSVFYPVMEYRYTMRVTIATIPKSRLQRPSGLQG
jgi:hypothetical protein